MAGAGCGIGTSGNREVRGAVLFPMLLFLMSCAIPPAVEATHVPSVERTGPVGGTEAEREEAPAESYAEARARIEADRVRLARLDRSIARAEARERLLDAFRDDLVPHWLGTDWAFYGTTTTPGEGDIACGYFVSTLLQHTGLHVERVYMAQQASEYIVKTFADEPSIARFRKGDEAAVVRWVKTQDDGLYVVGLDFHVGMLVKRGAEVELCHSAYTGDQVVVCSDPLADDGFVSRYHVVGPVLTDRVVDAWLDGQEVRTYRK